MIKINNQENRWIGIGEIFDFIKLKYPETDLSDFMEWRNVKVGCKVADLRMFGVNDYSENNLKEGDEVTIVWFRTSRLNQYIYVLCDVPKSIAYASGQAIPSEDRIIEVNKY